MVFRLDNVAGRFAGLISPCKKHFCLFPPSTPSSFICQIAAGFTQSFLAMIFMPKKRKLNAVGPLIGLLFITAHAHRRLTPMIVLEAGAALIRERCDICATLISA